MNFLSVFMLGNVHVLQRYGERFRRYLEVVHQLELPPEAQALRGELRINHVVNDLPSLMEGTLEGAQRTADIVSGLKRFSAVVREEVTPVELNAVVDRAIHWVKKGTAPGFEIRWSRGADCYVSGNAGQLLQVLMNLTQNAYDAAVTGGDKTPQLHITLERDDANVRLLFADNGPGIAPEHLSRIFDPFFTTKARRQRHGPGPVDQLRYRRAARRATQRGKSAARRGAVHAELAFARALVLGAESARVVSLWLIENAVTVAPSDEPRF